MRAGSNAFESGKTSVVVETSTGPVALTHSENAFLGRLLADKASMSEAQAFYHTVTKRGVPFPMEWELHVLRATVLELPNRDDLTTRLALVEQTLSTDHAATSGQSASNRVDAAIETSTGTIIVSPAEHTTLNRLLADQASMAEAQAFYQTVANRGIAFPIEWELHVLRATIPVLPDRDDLAARLVLVEKTLAERPWSNRTAAEPGAPGSGSADVIVETSTGSIALTAENYALLNRLLADTASMAEGQAFFQALSSRSLPFPMEWEMHVLRATIASLPDRDDLVARLAFVEQTLSPRSAADVTARLAFEKAWVRFTQVDLLASRDRIERQRIQKAAIDDACVLLSCAVFAQQSIARRVSLIVALHNTLMSDPSPDMLIVADLGLRRFRDMLESAELTEPDACALYDALHSLYFSGASDVRDLRRFDAIVAPFEKWLAARHGHHPASPLARSQTQPLTIAYLLHTAHLARGNAVSPLIGSLAIMHAARSDRRILLYAVQHVAPEFTDWMTGHGVTMRCFPQGYLYDRIDDVAASLKSDKVDIVVTEQNRSIATSLFVRRVASRQMWIDTGFPFWSLKALDWTISPVFGGTPDSVSRTSPIHLRQMTTTLKGPVDAVAAARVRGGFPAGAFVLGVFVRLIKLTQPYLDFLDRLLQADRQFHLVIAGPGDPGLVEAFVERHAGSGRVSFVPGNVDLNVYGPAIDLMCDTFPFIGGIACREVASHGTPVLAKLGTPWDVFLKADRNPELLADSEDAFIALALRIKTDVEFRQRQRQVTLDKAAAYADPRQMIEDVEAAIALAMAYDPGN